MTRQLFHGVLVLLVVLSTRLTSNAEQSEGQTSVFEGQPYQLQRLDQPAPQLVPLKPRTAETQRKLTSAAWFMAGRLHEKRERFDEALSAYEKAAKADPDNVQVYRSLINMALRLGKDDKAVGYAMEAVKLDPGDFRLLRQLGVEMVKNRKLPQAIKYLEQARQSPKLEKNSGFYVLINRDLGIIYSSLGETEKAADAYEVVLSALLNPSEYGLNRRTRDELQKDRNTSFEKIGQVLLKANRTDRALSALEKAAAKRDGNSGNVSYLLAQLYFQKEQYQKALKQLNQFFESKLNRGQGPYALFERVLEKLGKEDSLASRLEELTKEDPTNQDVKLALARAYVEDDRLEDAEAIFKTALEDGASTEAFMGLAQIYRRQKKAAAMLENMAKVFLQEWRRQRRQAGRGQEVAMPEALETELKVLQQDEILLDEVLDVLRNQTEDGAHAEHFGKLLMMAEVTADADRIDDSVELYRLAIDANPASAQPLYIALGSLLMGHDRYEEAADIYRDAITKPVLQGAKPLFLLNLATALELAGQTDAALEAIDDGNNMFPRGLPIFAFRKAWINYHARRFETAAKLFEEFIEKYSDDDPSLTKRAKFNLSAVYVQMKDFRRGEEILEKYYAENPDDIGVNNDLGYLYADQGKNLEKAKKMIQKAVEAEPENAAYLDSMGWVLFKLGETDEAISWLKKATDQENGDDPTIWEHLGDAYSAADKSGQARQAWKKALEMARDRSNPDPELVKRLKEKLDVKGSDVDQVQTESKDDP